MSLVAAGSGKASREGAAMEGDEPSAPRRDPFEDAYRAYARAMKEAWAEVEVELVREGRPHWHFYPMNTWHGARPPVSPLIILAPCAVGTWGSFGTFGTYGTYGTYGTGWSSAGHEPPESTEG
jgi:hypothetical protein